MLDRPVPPIVRVRTVMAAMVAAQLLAACASAPSGAAPRSVPSAGKAGQANLVSKGGANLVSKGGANIVPTGGGNIVPTGGGNIVPTGGGNIVPTGGGNIVPTGGGNVISNGGASFTGPHAGFAMQLQDLAAIGHTRAAAQIIATNGAGIVSNNTSGIIANNAGGLIANNAGSLVSNNAGSLVGNNTAGIVSNGGGNAISNNGASFRLAQLAAPAFSLEPEATEAPPEEVALPDGTTALAFERADGTRRIVIVNADRRPLEQAMESQVTLHADGTLASSHTERRLVYGNDQRRRGFLAYDERYDEAGRLLSLKHAPSELEEPISGLKIAVQALNFTVEPPSGSFEVRFDHLAAVEKGTITQVVRNLGGKSVGLDLADPLGTLGGQSRFETADGKLLFERKTLITGAEHRLQLTLRDGYALDVARTARTAPYKGAITLNGAAIGTATLTTRADASVTYEVAFDGDTPPIKVDIPDAGPAASQP